MTRNIKRNLKEDYDFAGYVTYNDIRCSDGAIIKQNAFSANDGQIVNISWNHKGKEDPKMILGQILLEQRDEGMWGYGKFNNTDRGQHSKEMVTHGDINAMSIGANRIQRDPLNPSNVIGGNIYEVSLVQAGANPKATIHEVMTHSNDDDFGSYVIFENGLTIIEHSEENNTRGKKMSYNDYLDLLEHSDDAEEIADATDEVLGSLTEEQRAAVAILIENSNEAAAEATAKEIFESDEYQTLVEAAETLVEIAESEDEEDEEVDEDQNEDLEQSDDLGGYQMRRNLFEESTLEHSFAQSQDREMVKGLILEAQSEIRNSDITLRQHIDELKHSDTERGEFLEHALNNVELLFPEYTTVNGVQFVYSKDTATEEIMKGVTKYPTGFVRTLAADLSDLTDEQLRAKGYIKGNQKKEQIFGFIDRKTSPQTIYKKQSIDRDDQIDMSKNLDVQMVYRTEMKSKINDEIAQAILVGDGRDVGNVDKIREDRIRPIITDDDFFTIKAKFDASDLTTLSETIDMEMIELQGSGTPAMIISPRLITQIRHLKDKDGLFLYGGRTPASLKDLADLFGVSKIIKSKFLNEKQIIIVNLADYGVGHENGGQLTSFEHFDIHVNKTYFLMETRLSGALTRPRSALFLTGDKVKSNDAIQSEYNKKFPKTDAKAGAAASTSSQVPGA